MTYEIQKYGQAILREIRNKEISDELEKKSDMEYHGSLTDFDLPPDLDREDFPSDKYCRIYRFHVHSILSDRD